MADKKKGYVPLYRSIQDNWIWQSEDPFDVRSAWVDLLLSVNHEEKKLCVNGKVIIIKPGQKWTSYRTLALKWGWSKDRVARYIKLLKSDGMIDTDETPNGTLLTVRNWSLFNGRCDTKCDTNKDTDKDTGKDTDKDETIMNNNDNNEKEKKIRKPKPPRDGTQWQ